MAEEERLTAPLQESVLTLLAVGKDEGTIAAELLSTEFFDNDYRDIAERLIRYRERYREGPGATHIDDVFDHVLSDTKHKQYRAYQSILSGILEQAKGLNAPYVLSRVQDFIRHQNLKAAVIEAGQRYIQGGDDVTVDVENILHEAHDQSRRAEGWFGSVEKVIRTFSGP